MRRLAALIVLVALLLAAAACAGDDVPPAAVVNGNEISQDRVIDELEAIRANTDYLQGLEAGGEQVLGTSEGTFSAPFAAQVLADNILFSFIADELDRRDITPGEDCIAAGRDDVERRLGSDVQSDQARGAVVLEAFPAWYQEELIERTANVLALQGALSDLPCVSDDAVQALYDEDPEQFRQVCFSLVTVASEEEAAGLRAQLDGGADIAALAQQHSIDTFAQAGGDVGCVVPGLLESVPELRDALFAVTPGSLGGPVESAVGWSVFLVREFRTPPLDEVRDDVARVLADRVTQRFRDWYAQAIDEAEVEVDERYGQWDPLTGSVRAPASPSTSEGDTGEDAES